jgi:hypothetical protein
MDYQELRQLEDDLWEAADQLRANSKLTASEYSMPVLGLIFLRHATTRFYALLEEVENSIPARATGQLREDRIKLGFQGKAAIYLPEIARYEYLASLPASENIAAAIHEAMQAIEDSVTDQDTLLCASVPLIFLLSMVYGSAAIELKQLLTLAFISGVFWIVWKQVDEPFIRLLDDRVVKAPAWVVGITEDPCELEMHRQDNAQWTRLVRFSAECPLCGGNVELRPGKPEHCFPLVGRCGNSPHAHVYSFDRMLLKGSYIGPPLAPAAVPGSNPRKTTAW